VILSRKLLAPTLLGIVFAIAAMTFISVRSQHGLIVERENLQVNVAYATFQAMLADHSELARALATSVADMPAVRTAFATGARQALEDAARPLFLEMRQAFHVTQMQFHVAPAVAFLRMEAPRLFGDDVSAFRRSVVRCNVDGSAQAGLEAGRTGIAMRGIVPVIHDRRYVGTLGFGIELDGHFLEQFKARTGAECAVFLTRRTIDIIRAPVGAPARGGPLPDLAELARTSVAAEVPPELFARALHGDTALERVEVGGSPYVVGLAPLLDYSGEVVGVVQLGLPRGNVLDRIAASRDASLLLGGAIAIVTVLAVWRLIAHRLVRPLGQLTASARRLEAGDRSARAGIASGDELGELGSAFDTMAEQLQAVLHGLEQKLAELERASRALRESEARYRRLVDTATEGVWVLDPDGVTVFVNRRMGEILGRPGDEVLGRSVMDLVAEEDVADQCHRMARHRAGSAEHYERRLRRPDGTTIWTSLSAAPIFDDERRFAGSFAMVTDISERKRAEEALASLNQRLEQRVVERTSELEAANRQLEEVNHELEAFSYSVSHDLRAPLRAIEGFARILLRDTAARLDAPARRHFDLICDSVERMRRLIEDLLGFSRTSRQEMALRTVDMAALAREVFDEVRGAAPGRTIVLRLGSMPPARGDRAMVRQVLVNLLSNAVKFTRTRAEAIIDVAGTSDGQQSTYCVEDNGVGFDMAYVNRLFGVFQRLHGPEEFEGTGIGLANVKRIITRHGGRVWAEGTVGEGARFHFTLPCA
jgi:PAS domain S-box-containing protein